MRVIYMAAPVSGDVRRNLERAKQWVRHLEEKNPDVAIVASWITECEVWNDAIPEQREAGFRRDLAIIERCDELWLVGPQVSKGMAIEKAHAHAYGLRVEDLTGTELPSHLAVEVRTIEVKPLRARPGRWRK